MNDWHTLNVLEKHVKWTSEIFLKTIWIKNNRGSDESANCPLIEIYMIIVLKILMKSILQLSKVLVVVRNLLVLNNQSVCSLRIFFSENNF